MLNLDNFTRMGLAYELSYLDDYGNKFVLESNGKMHKDPVVADFEVHNLNWELAVIPESGWIDMFRIMWIVVVWMLLTVFTRIIKELITIKKDSEHCHS